MRGVFITLEGADGCGKSTQAELLEAALSADGREVVRLREPGGTALSEKIRGLLLDPANAEMVPECELLLYEASRAQLTRQVIEPALARGAGELPLAHVALHGRVRPLVSPLVDEPVEEPLGRVALLARRGCKAPICRAIPGRGGAAAPFLHNST